MTVPALMSACYVLAIDQYGREAVDDWLFTSPEEKARRQQEERRQLVLASGGEIADVIPLRGVS